MNWQRKYQEWLDYPSLEANLKDQLLALSDPAVIEEHFYDYLAFGTGGCGRARCWHQPNQ